jgi:PAS domain S-box-containing protein
MTRTELQKPTGESEARFHAVIASMGGWIWETDAQGRYIYCSQKVTDILGHVPEEVLGKTPFDFMRPDEAKRVGEIFGDIVAHKAPIVSLENWNVTKDGREVCLLTSGVPVLDPDGNLVGYWGIDQDITERKQADAALRESLQTSADIINSIPSGLFTYQYEPPDRLILLDGNPVAERMTGLNIAESRGKEFNELWPQAREAGITAEYLRVMETGEMYETEDVYYEDERITGSFATRVFRMPGERLGVAFENTTARKQAETERVQLQQEIIEAQQRAIQELSTPVIPVMDRILVMPLVGSIDTLRAKDVMRTLLAGIREHRARVVLLDVTGVPIMDSGVVSHLNKTIQAARLKGARAIVTGLSDAVAEAIVDLGIDWSGVMTLSDLQTGLLVALNGMGLELKRKA